MRYSALLAALALFDLTTASPTRLRRRTHGKLLSKRSCAPKQSLTASLSASTTPSPAAATLSGVQNLAVVANEAEVGHWEVITTSVFVDDGAYSASSAVASSSAQVTSQNTNQETVTVTVTTGTSSSTSYAAASTASSSAYTSVGGDSDVISSAASIASSVASTTSSASSSSSSSSGSTSSDKHVFAHFMVGIVSTYAQSDWESDMSLAKSKGITGFALNIGVDSYAEAQLDLGYAAAAAVGFDVFISFDFNWYTISNTSGVISMLQRYVNQPAQFKIDGKPFVSTFIGDGFDWGAVESGVGQELYSVPFWQPSSDNAANAGLSGLFSWDAWPGQLDNQPVCANMTDDRDLLYLSYTNAVDKAYMAPVSPWFSTHFGAEVSYSKNWVFYSEMLWKTRWDQILSLGSQLNFIEIVTWNDYGESHYIGPYDTPHTDDGSSKWASGFDHTPMLDMAQPYIEAFKSGATTPTITDEMLVYWHRPHLKSASCDSTDNCGSKPTGWDFLEDSVFVTALTKSGGTITVTSGSNAAFVQTVEAGVQVFSVPMGVGTQSFSMTTTAGGSVNGVSNVTISADCWNGIYNFNFHSGSLKV